MGDQQYRYSYDHSYTGNNYDAYSASLGPQGQSQTQSQYVRASQDFHRPQSQQGRTSGFVYPSQYFGQQESFQHAGSQGAMSGFQSFPSPASQQSGVLPASVAHPPDRSMVSSSTLNWNDNHFPRDHDIQLNAQLGEVTRHPFTRLNADGKEEYDPSMPRTKGNTIPDPTSVEEGGRTYQTYREGKYYMPNDAIEQDRSVYCC